MDVIEIILGRVIIRFFGAYTRFVFFYLLGKKKDIKNLYGKNNTSLHDGISQDFWNVIIGFFMFGLVSFCIVYLSFG